VFIWIRSCLTLAVLALWASTFRSGALGAEPKIRVMTISPASEAVPALQNRLLPLESELTPGDAAPIYIRLTSDLTTDALSKLSEKPKTWLALPFDQFPAREARTFLDGWRPKLAQLEYGARRATCSWNYSLLEERDHITDVVLPDAQSMRTWSRLLALEARVEISDRQFAAAVRTIETGLSVSRHVGDGPFFINVLIGNASARLMLDEVENLISQPGAPSLYWSLTALPRPFLDMRKSLAHEYKMFEWLLPEMTDLESNRSDAEWASRLARFHGRVLRIKAIYQKGEPSAYDWGEIKEKLTDFKDWVLPSAKEYFEARKGKVSAQNDDEMILKFFGGRYHELYDDMYKAAYLPFLEAEPYYARGEKQLRSVKNGPLAIFPHLIANVKAFHLSQPLLDRKVAMLRVVEALRLHAGVAGRLPDSLAQVKGVPIPIDPYSGKAFGYELKGDTAELVGTVPKEQQAFGLTYRITLRK
jgi:hypothetical protein